MKLVSSERFIKELNKLTRRDAKYSEKVAKCLNLVIFDIRHPSLRLHKLAGLEVYSVSVDMKIRILVNLDDENIFLLRIGTHDEVY